MSSAYNIRLTQLSPEDGGVYLAWVPDLPGCMSDGNTPEEAYANAMDAIDDWISEAIRLGRVVPREVMESELRLMKQHNINAIRTSHYPPHPDVLALADRLGFYVVLECDLETHGFEEGAWQHTATWSGIQDVSLRPAHEGANGLDPRALY